jgi:hypothetical protein
MSHFTVMQMSILSTFNEQAVSQVSNQRIGPFAPRRTVMRCRIVQVATIFHLSALYLIMTACRDAPARPIACQLSFRQVMRPV